MSTRNDAMAGSYPGLDVIDARNEKGWTQVELARRLEIAPQTLCDIELGRRAVSFKIAYSLSRVFPEYGSAYGWARKQFEYDWAADSRRPRG